MTHNPFTSNIIIYDHYEINQENINEALSKYSRIRDYSHETSFKNTKLLAESPYIVVANIIASALNSSLISLHEYPEFVNKRSTTRNVPSILPKIETNDLIDRRVAELWMSYRKFTNFNPKQELSQFIQVHSMDANFVYCEVPKSKRINPLLFSDFTSPFDIYTWISLLITAILVTLVLGKSKWPIALSAVLSFGVSKLKGQASKFQLILVMWMLGTCVVTQLYLGKVTSLVIIPPEDDILASLMDIKRNNYTLIFCNEHVLNMAKEAYQQVDDNHIDHTLRVLGAGISI